MGVLCTVLTHFTAFSGAPLVSGVSPSQLSVGLSSATLTCETTFNFPVGMVAWEREDGVELSSERFSLASNGELLIMNVTLEDQSVYVCNVTNLYGTSSVSSTISVLSKSFFPCKVHTCMLACNFIFIFPAV